MMINQQPNSLTTHDHVHHAPNIERKKERNEMKQNKTRDSMKDWSSKDDDDEEEEEEEKKQQQQRHKYICTYLEPIFEKHSKRRQEDGQ